LSEQFTELKLSDVALIMNIDGMSRVSIRLRR